MLWTMNLKQAGKLIKFAFLAAVVALFGLGHSGDAGKKANSDSWISSAHADIPPGSGAGESAGGSMGGESVGAEAGGAESGSGCCGC